MKKVLASVLFLLVGVMAWSQSVTYVDGLYVDASGAPYSGTYKTNDDFGHLKASYTIDKGVLSGLAVFYYTNGAKMESGNYVAGERDGLWESWNKDAMKTGEARFSKGIKDGRWIVWDDKGQKRAEMFYASGRKAETWSMWDETGALVSQKTFLPEQ